jgi:hypothetical protein
MPSRDWRLRVRDILRSIDEILQPLLVSPRPEIFDLEASEE